ncbi:hypothetical protein [Sediminibacter sp. Hel_I_10]|uniref:hypothetical protein n=1 Tax=Sediminibacter sp. Hel_I_10 TaxID=1392490 RepID=UPI00047C3916|nr:hypothetical protein [Sediminibacter sp. Hel_I_10]
MAENSKNLSDDLNEMLDDAKESAHRAGEKISSSTKEFNEEAKEFGREAREKARAFSDEAHNSAKAFSQDAEQAFSDGKNVAIIAHLTIIGWIIAMVMNSNNKTEFGSFYIRQTLGLILCSLVAIIPLIGWLLWIVVFVAWIMSLVSSLNGKMKPTFLLGEQFQEWFKNL